MCRWYSLGIMVMLLCASDNLKAECPKKALVSVLNVVKNHPFIAAAVIILVLQKEPLECIKGTIRYLIEEHPIICILVLGLCISGSFNELSYLEQIGNVSIRYMMRCCSWLLTIIEKTI